MIFFEYFLILVLLGLCLGSIWLVLLFMRRRLYRWAITSRAVHLARKQLRKSFFSYQIISDVSDVLFKAPFVQRKEFLKHLGNGNYTPLVDFVRQYDECLAYAFAGHFEGIALLAKIKRLFKIHSNDQNCILSLACLYDMKQDYDKLKELLKNTENLHCKKGFTALKLLLEGKINIYDADMNPASKGVFESLKFAHKKRYEQEEIAAYFVLGEIYRFSSMFDEAYMIFETVKNMCHNLGDYRNYGLAIMEQGIILFTQERFAEADDCFMHSYNIFDRNNFLIEKAKAMTRQASLRWRLKRLASARKKAEKAISLNVQLNEPEGEACSRGILALIALETGNFEQAVRQAKKASEIHKKYKNYWAYLEMLNIQAQACFNMGKFDQVLSLCEQMLRVARYRKTCFDINEVYKLLSGVYAQKGDFDKAEKILQKVSECK